MPTLFDKVDQFWRDVGGESKIVRGTSPAEGSSAARRMSASSSSRPPLPPSTKMKSASNGQHNNPSDRITGRPPVPFSSSATIKANSKGKFDRNRRCYSSLSLNSTAASSNNNNNNIHESGSGGVGGSKGSKSSRNRLGSMGGSIVDIYEFCKSQASKKLHYPSHLSRLKSLSKSNVFGGSTMSVCGPYPSIQEEVMMERPARKTIDLSNNRSSCVVVNSQVLSSNNNHVKDGEDSKISIDPHQQQQHKISHHVDHTISEESDKGSGSRGGDDVK